MRTQVRPIFFLFLVLGPFAVVLYLMTRPVQITLEAAWRKCPTLLWRPAVVVSVLVASLATLPGSPIFIGLNRPIPIDPVQKYPLIWALYVVVNVGLIGMLICFPVSAAATLHTYRTRKRTRSE